MTPLPQITTVSSASMRLTWPEPPCISFEQELQVRMLPDGWTTARRIDLSQHANRNYKLRTQSYTLTDLVPQKSYELRLVWNDSAGGVVAVDTPAATCVIM